jgi:phosphate transport system ATP-binding protein
MHKITIENLRLRYSDGNESLKGVSLGIEANAITVLFGPAGGGKSSLLRVLNRLANLADVVDLSGKVMFNDIDILGPNIDVVALRRKIGIVFSRPVSLPLTIYRNVSFALEMGGEHRKDRLDERVEIALRDAMLWDEVNDRLKEPANSLSGGQQQRLSLARVLALEPEVIMLDEPTSALDPIATSKIEAMLQELKQKFTIIIAPHNIQQSARVADYAAFFLQGELIEYGKSVDIFMKPKEKRTQDYIEGRFG